MRADRRPAAASSNDHCDRRDAGVVATVDVLFVAIAVLAAVVFLGYMGRLHAAGIEVTTASQTAARAASLSPDSATAESAARAAVEASALAARCSGGALTQLEWTPSPIGTWQGGSVRVVVSCTVSNAGLAGFWTPGSRTIAASDQQPIDRYTR